MSKEERIFKFAEKLPDCSKCIHYEEIDRYHYTCKYIRGGKTFFQSDSTDTAYECRYYKEAEPFISELRENPRFLPELGSYEGFIMPHVETCPVCDGKGKIKVVGGEIRSCRRCNAVPVPTLNRLRRRLKWKQIQEREMLKK